MSCTFCCHLPFSTTASWTFRPGDRGPQGSWQLDIFVFFFSGESISEFIETYPLSTIFFLGIPYFRKAPHVPYIPQALFWFISRPTRELECQIDVHKTGPAKQPKRFNLGLDNWILAIAVFILGICRNSTWRYLNIVYSKDNGESQSSLEDIAWYCHLEDPPFSEAPIYHITKIRR